jgi:uncharacterized protein (TIGR03083 family)
MPASLTLSEHLDVLASSGTRLADLALDAGLDALVPTCPDWTVDALVAHQAMVHRWAAAHVRGDDPDAVPDDTTIRATTDDLVEFYREGHRALLAAFRDAAPDLEAITFLNDAPPPREFWARRQAHETTIHMVDAFAASVGRLPTSNDIGVDAPVAIDGIDELLRGFLTRGRSKLYDGTEYTVVVAPIDSDRRWIVNVAERLTVQPDGADPNVGDADATLSGTAAQLYLALWNRGDQVVADGRADLLERWRVSQRISWN